MSMLFECEYDGERLVGFDRAAPGEPQRLFRIPDDRLRAAVTSGDATAVRTEALAGGAAEVTVPAGVGEPRYLPPLLPTYTGNALVSGFMGTHRSKFDRAPEPDEEFRAPNWLIKGLATWLRMPGETMTVPASAIALLEEPEVALVYVNDDEGTPHYAGYTFGNDLNDIGLHLRNPWGWTPYAKLCDTSMTPWLFLDKPPQTVTGRIVVERAGETAWEGPFSCGADSIFQRVDDMVDNLFSYPPLRRPGLVNYLLLGADKASYHDGFLLADGDLLTIEVTSHDVVLANAIRYADPVSKS